MVGRDGGDGTSVVLFGSPPWGGGFASLFFLFAPDSGQFRCSGESYSKNLCIVMYDWIHRTGISFGFRV